MTKEQLYQMRVIDLMTYGEMAEIFECSKQNVQQQCARYNIPTVKNAALLRHFEPEQREPIYWLELIEQYPVEKRQVKTLAKDLNIKPHFIYQLLKILNLTEIYHPSDEVRFYNKVKVNTETGCHEWMGVTHLNGYGWFTVGLNYKWAHRIAWELFVGPIPEGKCVLHKCDNKLCVNIDHLYIGTHKDNARDREERNPNSLTNGRRLSRKIKDVCLLYDKEDKLIASFSSQKELSEIMNLNQGTISAHKQGKIKWLRNKYRVDFV